MQTLKGKLNHSNDTIPTLFINSYIKRFQTSSTHSSIIKMPGTKKRPNLFLAKEAKEEEEQQKKKKLKTLSLVPDELDTTDGESGDEFPEYKKPLVISERIQDSQPSFDSTLLTSSTEHQPEQLVQDEHLALEGDGILPPPNPIDLLKLSSEAPIEKRGDLTVLKLGEKTTIHVVKG